MKKIGFLSFGHWAPSPQSRTRSASDALLQSIELAVAAEELGADGAYFRVHHFARQLASPFPLLAAIGARTSRIEIGTGVIDMRYENPLYMAEDAGADLDPARARPDGRQQRERARQLPREVVHAEVGPVDPELLGGHGQLDRLEQGVGCGTDLRVRRVGPVAEVEEPDLLHAGYNTGAPRIFPVPSHGPRAAREPGPPSLHA